MPLDFPIIYLLPNRLGAEELHELEDQIPTLTYDVNEAEVLLGKVSHKQRALFELRHLKLPTEEVPTPDASLSPRVKRRNVSGSTQRPPDSDSGTASDNASDHDVAGRAAEAGGDSDKTIKVVNLSWFTDSLKNGVVQPFTDYLLYEGRRVHATPLKTPPSAASSAGILSRARADTGDTQTSPLAKYGKRSSGRYGGSVKPPALIKQTTSEDGADFRLPPIPDYLRTPFSCQRPTPASGPNEAFIDQLKKIRRIRTLTGDKIGIRAYSSSIATLAAYPYALSSPQGQLV